MDPKCLRCGGFLDPTCSWSCKFCGAQQPLPEGCVPLTDDGVLGLLRQRVTGLDSTSLHPSIPPKKLNGVRSVHAAHLPPHETVLAIYDGTVFGSATDGFFVTAKRIGFKNQLESAQFIDWQNVDPDDVYVDEKTLVVGSARIETLYDDEDGALWTWSEVIASIARSARPAVPRPNGAAQTGPAAMPQPTGPSAWEGARSSWPPPPPSYDRSELVERLARKPYAADQSCSVVDVQASGQLFVACGGATVEIRYAANGARYRAFQAPDLILCARFSPDGRQLAVGGLDAQVTVYDVESGRILGASPKMSDTVDEIAWLGSTGRFAVASQRGELWIVDAATCMPVHTILGVDPEYNSLGGICATTDGAVVFVSLGSRLGAFDTASGKILWRFDEALVNASRLAVSPRGDVLVAAGYDGVALFDARTGQPGARYPLAQARGVSWPEGGGGLFSAPEVGEYSWSPRPRFSPSGDLVAVQDPVGNLAFIDTTSYALHPTPRDHGRAWIEDLAWFGDGNHLVVGSSDNTLAIWRVRPMQRVMHAGAIGA